MIWYGDGVGDYCSVTWPLPLTVQREGRGGMGVGVTMSVTNVGIFYRSPVGKPVLFVLSAFTYEIYKEEEILFGLRNFRKIFVW